MLAPAGASHALLVAALWLLLPALLGAALLVPDLFRVVVSGQLHPVQKRQLTRIITGASSFGSSVNQPVFWRMMLTTPIWTPASTFSA